VKLVGREAEKLGGEEALGGGEGESATPTADKKVGKMIKDQKGISVC